MALSIQHPGRSSQALVEVRAEGLPQALIRAKEAIEQDRFDDARALLDETAIGQVRRLVSEDPLRTDVMAMMGLMEMRLRRHDEAEGWFREILRQGADPWVLQQLSGICSLKGRFCQATDLRKEALALTPDDVRLQADYGLDLISEGRLEEGLEILKAAVEADPDNADIHAQWLFHMHYLQECDRSWLAGQYRQWGQRHWPLSGARTFHDRDPDPNRRLRVGLLSGDFRSHSVVYGLEPILEHHDHDRIHLYAYSNVPSPDAVTERLKTWFEAYRDIRHLDDQAVADLIEQDRIDILVAVAGPTEHHRLGVVARRPAPLQVDYGNLSTLGMGQVAYRLTDEVLDPLPSQVYYMEELVYLPGGFVCYRPPVEGGAVPSLHTQTNGSITFGSFNNSMKINPYLISLWTDILRATPGSRLLLKFAGGDESRIRDRFLGRFEQAGLSADRIEIIGWKSPRQHLEMYHRVDIALDTYPFNGCITTLEGLWMGVPLVTLAGDRYVSRVGLDILSQMGLNSLVSCHPQEYVAKAVALAQNGPALAKIRGSLRRAMAASSLCDGKAHARALEQVYRWMWRRWCRNRVKRSRIQEEVRGTPPCAAPVPPSEPDRQDVLELFIREGSALTCKVDKRRLPPFLLDAAMAIERGHVDQAIGLLNEEALQAAIPAQDPEEVLFMIGTLLARAEQCGRAEWAYREVLKSRPHALAHFALGGLCHHAGRMSEAVEHLEKAVALSPKCSELRVTLAEFLIQAGQPQKGLERLHGCIMEAPDCTNHSKYLWYLHHSPVWDLAGLAEEHRRWGRTYGPPDRAGTSHPNDPAPDRRLRVGYISPDFCGHSVAYFFESLLDGHDPSQVETFGYGNVLSPDQVTERLQSRFHHYRHICGLDDVTVVRQIEADGIDILVDLAGHTGRHRLSVFAHRPAPVQVSFLGYPGTTGLEQIDYRFTDRWADLPEAQRFYTERLVSLPSGFICYRPPGFAPAVGPLPAQGNGFVTFGSFNSNTKIHDHAIRWWSQVLREVPGSRMLLKFNGGQDPAVRDRYLSMFDRQGVSPERVRIVGRLPVLEHFDLYNQVDVGLDTFPYHGTTTTCEALWMGVPTVSLIGEHHASRVGLSLLTRVGLEVFTASTDREYVAKAVAFAGQLDDLAAIRRSLRSMMLHSTLCDGKAYARDVESAYRQMWRAWCDRRGDLHGR